METADFHGYTDIPTTWGHMGYAVVTIYDGDLNLDTNRKGLWEELSRPVLVWTDLQKEFHVYNWALPWISFAPSVKRASCFYLCFFVQVSRHGYTYGIAILSFSRKNPFWGQNTYWTFVYGWHSWHSQHQVLFPLLQTMTRAQWSMCIFYNSVLLVTVQFEILFYQVL